MSNRLPISGEYPPDWPQIGDRIRAEVGHRCIRCYHPYQVGKHGKGEWTPCDIKCVHGGPLAIIWPNGHVVEDITGATAPEMFRLNHFGDGKEILARWRILTVHHLDGNKANCEWWNLLALCQRCHLTIQTRINPEIPYFLEHSDWAKPYIAGFYAKKYEGRLITRQEAEQRLDELLAHERLI